MRVVIAVLFASIMVGDAAAQSCASLRNQLAVAQRSAGGGDTGRLQAQYRAFSCGSTSRFGRHRACAGIEARLRRGGGGGGRQVASLRRQVAAACAPSRAERRVVRNEDRGPSSTMIGGRVVQQRTEPANEGFRDGRGGFFSRVFGGERRRDVQTVRADPAEAVGRVERVEIERARPARERARDEPVESQATQSGTRVKGELREGSSRTVCVRLCDGFYFPINSRSHSDNYYDELAMCVGRCPGADVSLYVHGAGSPVESMRSTMTGERYVNLPTAFVYRKASVPACGCQATTTASVVGSASRAGAALGYADRSDAGAPVDADRGSDAANPAVPTTAADIADETAEGGRRWSPFRAIYDETGKPLRPLLTDRSLSTETDADKPASPALAPRPDRSGVAVALEGSGDVREVGPQFYSDATGPTVTRLRSVAEPLVTTTAITVIPLSSAQPVNLGPRPGAAPDGLSSRSGTKTWMGAAATSAAPSRPANALSTVTGPGVTASRPAGSIGTDG